MKTAKMIIGENLKEARKYKGLTQKEVGQALHMTQQQYSRFENGVFELNYDQILFFLYFFVNSFIHYIIHAQSAFYFLNIRTVYLPR